MVDSSRVLFLAMPADIYDAFGDEPLGSRLFRLCGILELPVGRMALPQMSHLLYYERLNFHAAKYYIIFKILAICLQLIDY